MVRDRFPGRGLENVNLLFDSDMVNLLLKTSGGRDRPNFVILVVWSALIVGSWVVVARGRSVV